MSRKLAAVAAVVVAAVTLSAVAAAGPRDQLQRVAMTAKKGNANAFVLTPLQPGPVVRDSGYADACCWSQRFVTRDGQSIEIDDPLKTFMSTRGTFTYRASIEWVDAGNGYSVGTGTWRIVRGTGEYAHLTGSGRLAVSWPSA